MEPQSNDALAANIKSHCDWLSDELVRIHLNWAMFKALFFTTSDQIELLASSAGAFFGYLNALLFDTVILGIARMTDKPKTGNESNYVLAILVKDLESYDVELSEKLSVHLAVTNDKVENIRSYRNKVLAHRDLSTFLAVPPSDAFPVTFDDVEESLRLMREFLNCLSLNLYDTTVYYEGIVPESVNRLIFRLLKANEYDAIVAEGLVPRDRIRASGVRITTGEKALYRLGSK